MYQSTKDLAVIFLCTENEYKSGFFEKCINKYLSNTVSEKYKFDFFLFFNRGNESQYPLIDKCKKHPNINKVFFHNHSLSDDEDVYYRTQQQMRMARGKKIHPLGGSGGANLLFYRSFESLYSKKYKNYLMIESDSKPIKSFWFDGLMSSIHKKQFLIYGSTYKGSQQIPDYEWWTGHLNGIAIYKNNQHTQHLLIESEKLIKYYVRHNINKFISFDVAIWNFTHTLNWQRYIRKNKINYEYLYDSPEISNYSLTNDIPFSIEDILIRHPDTIILHQKWN